MKTTPTPSSTEYGYFFPPAVAKQLLDSKRKVDQGNQDRIFIVDGREGSGKSTLAFQMANIVDNDFTIDQIVFTSEQFETLIRKIDRLKAIVFDEAFNGLSSKSAMSQENKKLVRLLMECRQRNLFIFIVLPSIFMLEKYVAIYRSQALFHTQIEKHKINRRYFQIYNYEKKTQLYILGKQMMSYSKPRIKYFNKFFGKFPSGVDEAAYVKKKLDSFKDMGGEVEQELGKYNFQRNYLVYYMNKVLKIHQKNIATIFKQMGYDVTHQAISYIVRQVMKSQDSKDKRRIYIPPKGGGKCD